VIHRMSVGAVRATAARPGPAARGGLAAAAAARRGFLMAHGVVLLHSHPPRRHGRPGVTPQLASGREVGPEDGGGARPGTLHGILAVGRIRGGRCKVRRRCCSDRRTEAVPGACEPARCHGCSMARSNRRCFFGRRGTLCIQRMARGRDAVSCFRDGMCHV